MLAQNKSFSCKVRVDKGIVKEHGMNNCCLSGVRQTITAINWSLHNNVCALTVFYIAARTTKRTLLIYFPCSLLLEGMNKKYLK
jgi:hypothetical protein